MYYLTTIILISFFNVMYSQNCLNDEVEIWDVCYSIESTTALQYLDNTYGEIPNQICELINLEILNLVVMFGNTNYVTGEIPECIGDLVNLNYLDLSWNQLSGEIPESIGNLINLANLNFSQNIYF